MEKRNLDEKIFCHYCKSSLQKEKERNQGYHDDCNNEFTFAQNFNFLQIDDKQILEQIITKYNVQCIANYEQSAISFSGFEQIDNRDSLPLLVILLGNGTEVVEGKTLMKIQDVKLHHFSEELTAELWNILKKTEIGSILKYLPIMEKNNFELLQKIHELVSFPNIYMKDDIILISPSRNTFDFEDAEIGYEEGEVLITKDDEEIDYAIRERMITILLITGQDGKKRILNSGGGHELNRKIRKIPGYFDLLHNNIFHWLAPSEQRFHADFKSNCLKYNILLEVGGGFDNYGSGLSLCCRKNMADYPESEEYGCDFFFTFELTQGQNKKFSGLNIYYLDTDRDTLNCALI